MMTNTDEEYSTDAFAEIEEDGLDLSPFEICWIVLIVLITLPILVLTVVVLAPFLLLGSIVSRISLKFSDEK